MNLEQELAKMRDTLPRVWWSLYQGSLAAGFDQFQSFALLQTWILGQNPNGSVPPRGTGPSTDEGS